jgi:hypothetical protein
LKYFYTSAKAIEAFGQVFVAALNGIYVAECRNAICGKHANEQEAGWTKGGRAEYVCAGELCRAGYVHAVRVSQLHRCTYFCNLCVINGAVFIHPVMNECTAFGDGAYRDKVGQVVGVYAGVGEFIRYARGFTL